MTGNRPATPIVTFGAAIAVFSYVAAPFVSAPADAQVYYSIYGGYRKSPPAPYRDDRPHSSGNPFVDFFGALFGGRGRYEDDEKDAYGQYCVRTCDGKFFPVSRGDRKDLSLDRICNAMCPATPTKVFSGRGIEHAFAADGQPYASSPNAFLYRTKIVENCSCNGRDPFGVVNVPIEKDVTLEGGDLVVRETGLTLYRGGQNFVPIEKSGMSSAYVKQLQAIKILPDNPHATFAKTMPVMETAPELTTQKTPNETPSPNANAPATELPARMN